MADKVKCTIQWEDPTPYAPFVDESDINLEDDGIFKIIIPLEGYLQKTIANIIEKKLKPESIKADIIADAFNAIGCTVINNDINDLVIENQFLEIIDILITYNDDRTFKPLYNISTIKENRPTMSNREAYIILIKCITYRICIEGSSSELYIHLNQIKSRLMSKYKITNNLLPGQDLEKTFLRDVISIILTLGSTTDITNILTREKFDRILNFVNNSKKNLYIAIYSRGYNICTLDIDRNTLITNQISFLRSLCSL